MTFKEYLDSRHETALQFARRSLLAFNTVKKLYHGEKVKRITAKKVERLTKKFVTLDEIDYEYR